MALWQRMRRTGQPQPTIPSVDDGELYSRNFAFIPQPAQTALKRTTLYAAGVGLASNIIVQACRTGFTRFILADGDQVELSNLNRQAYNYSQIGMNKAEALAELLRAIRPDVVVETFPMFLDETSCLAPLEHADIVINSIDFHQPAAFRLNRMAQVREKPVLLPMNLGWGGALLAFLPDSPTLEQFIGYNPRIHAPTEVVKLLTGRIYGGVPGGVPSYMAPIFAQFVSGQVDWRYEPQIAAASAVTSALAVRAAVALAAGEPVRGVPEVLFCDVRQIAEPPLEDLRLVRARQRQASGE